jgi:hypothetical protein
MSLGSELGSHKAQERGNRNAAQPQEEVMQSIEASVDAIEAGFHFPPQFAYVQFDAIEALVDSFEAMVDDFKPLVDSFEAPVDLIKPTIDLIEPFVDAVEPLFETLVGPALRHRLHDATVTRCLHAVARTASVLCDD